MRPQLPSDEGEEDGLTLLLMSIHLTKIQEQVILLVYLEETFMPVSPRCLCKGQGHIEVKGMPEYMHTRKAGLRVCRPFAHERIFR